MMTSSFQTLMAAEHVADLRREAEHRQLARAVAQPTATSDSPARVLALRLAHADEADVVRELAELDGAPALEGDVLLALVDGKPIAGLSLRDRRVVATPFVPTSQAVALLHVRAGQLLGPPRRRRLRVLLRTRLA